MNRLAAFAVALACVSCTIIDQRAPVPGLEHLVVTERYVPAAEIAPRCHDEGGVPYWVMPIACTIFDYEHKTAIIYLPEGAPEWVVWHERMHGKGYDHTDGSLAKEYNGYLQGRLNKNGLISK